MSSITRLSGGPYALHNTAFTTLLLLNNTVKNTSIRSRHLHNDTMPIISIAKPVFLYWMTLGN